MSRSTVNHILFVVGLLGSALVSVSSAVPAGPWHDTALAVSTLLVGLSRTWTTGK